MDNRIIDLEELFPENETIVITDKAGKKYPIKMFIPAAVGFTIIDNIDKLGSIFPQGANGKPRINRESIELVLKILADICKTQHPEIDKQWIQDNVSLPRQAFIIYRLAIPVYDFLRQSGFLEAVKPEKTPEK